MIDFKKNRSCVIRIFLTEFSRPTLFHAVDFHHSLIRSRRIPVDEIGIADLSLIMLIIAIYIGTKSLHRFIRQNMFRATGILIRSLFPDTYKLQKLAD